MKTCCLFKGIKETVYMHHHQLPSGHIESEHTTTKYVKNTI